MVNTAKEMSQDLQVHSESCKRPILWRSGESWLTPSASAKRDTLKNLHKVLNFDTDLEVATSDVTNLSRLGGSLRAPSQDIAVA